MNIRISIIDYGINNINSLKMAIDSVGFEALITSDYKEIDNADKIILPGVGSFENGMKNLNKINIIESLKKAYLANKGILAICLGMQMLLTTSTEFGIFKGLNFIDGKVNKIPSSENKIKKRRIPHVGWNTISLNQSCKSPYSKMLEENEKNNDYFYFTHSYYALPNDQNNIVSYSNYDNFYFPSIITSKNLLACQFHPEKSGVVGLNLIKKFLDKKND